MIKLTKLNDVYENWLTGDGVFTDLNNFNVPWKNENNIMALNTSYHGSHSGDKNISPIVYKFLNSDESENMRSRLANVIFTMYGDKWDKLWNAFNIEYNPIENYSMIENETIGETVDNSETHTGTSTVIMTGTDTETHTGTDTEIHTGTDTNARTGSENETHTGTDNITHSGNTENEISAFNSSDYVDNSKDSINTSDNETRNLSDSKTYNNLTDTETVNLTDAIQYGKTETETRNMSDATTRNLSDSFDGQKDIERELTRSGNIGVTTSQQMLQSEIELRKWVFYQSVFDDIDSILTLKIY